MVCPKCVKKLAKLGAPDVHGKTPNDSTSNASSGRMINENKALSSKKNRFQPYQKFKNCKVCKVKTHHAKAHYCNGCAFKIGICCMCGKQIVSDDKLKNSKQSCT
mmetsp:Transcript_91985/g.127698  ORF Transcript_91985/g.127698 Transcript_91985/m.127698 type:complete len:105 (-) Transcript_91985:564-878(-)